MALKTERGNRVFPVSDRAMDIADALVRFARQGGVQIKQATVSELIQREDVYKRQAAACPACWKIAGWASCWWNIWRGGR